MPRTARLTAILKGCNVYSARACILGNRSVENTHRRSVLKAGLPNARLRDLPHMVGSWLIHAGLHVETVRTMLGHQMVNLFNRPNWQGFATDSAAVG